jgi:hypothetical protein
MAGIVYHHAMYAMGRGSISLSTDTIMCVLMSNGYTPARDDVSWGQISGGAATAAGGYAPTSLTSVSWTDSDANDNAVFDAADVTWASATVAADGAMLYDGTTTSDLLLAYYSFGSVQSASAAEFKIQWSASGIFKLSN